MQCSAQECGGPDFWRVEAALGEVIRIRIWTI